ncbi:hypothetical protein Tco_1434674 [Tanacetum coccineum]
MYDSWASRIRLLIKGKKNGRMMLDSIDNGPLVYPTVEENGQTRPKKYSELTEAQQLQDNSKNIWDRVKLLMKDIELSYQERECILCNLFDKFAYVQVTQQSQNEFPQLDSSLVVPTFQQGDDPIECINKAMAFLSIVASRLLPSNHHLRTSSNPKNQATIQDERVTVQQGTIPHNSAFQTEDLDAYDSNCDDISSAKAILMANLSSCDPDVLSEVPYSDSYPNDMINQDVQEMPYSEHILIIIQIMS